jgi:hypothetical protein
MALRIPWQASSVSGLSVERKMSDPALEAAPAQVMQRVRRALRSRPGNLLVTEQEADGSAEHGPGQGRHRARPQSVSHARRIGLASFPGAAAGR